MSTPPTSAMISSFKGRKARSHLYRWLWDNFEPLHQARQASAGVVDWVGVALELNHIGLRNRDGQPLKSESVRRTFARVERDRAARPLVSGMPPNVFNSIPSSERHQATPPYPAVPLPPASGRLLPAFSGAAGPQKFNFALAIPRKPKDLS